MINFLKTIIKKIFDIHSILECVFFVYIYIYIFQLKIQLTAIYFSNVSGCPNFKYFYAIAGIGRFESFGETILYQDVLTRISRKFGGLHCVRIYRLTCTAIPVGFSAVNSSVDRDRSQTRQIQW